jgi:hypothetical protein
VPDLLKEAPLVPSRTGKGIRHREVSIRDLLNSAPGRQLVQGLINQYLLGKLAELRQARDFVARVEEDKRSLRLRCGCGAAAKDYGTLAGLYAKIPALARLLHRAAGPHAAWSRRIALTWKATKGSPALRIGKMRSNYSRKVMVEGKGFVDCVLNLRSTLARTIW